jgi:hypothetical protein
MKDVVKIQYDPIHSAGQYHKTGVPETNYEIGYFEGESTVL